MAEQVCNVFISHIHEDDHRLQPLKDLLAKHGCTARDGSINCSNPNRATDPDYIKREILRPRIDWCGTLVVLVSPETKHSDWVNWEIEEAHKAGKRIVGVWDHGECECDLPEKLEEYGNPVVGWRAEQVIDAIFGRIDDWRDADGNPLPERVIPRHVCR